MAEACVGSLHNTCLHYSQHCVSLMGSCSHFRLSDCNKENSFRSYVPQKSSLRSEEQRSGTGSEVISKGSYRKADGQRQAFDYVELSPLQQGPLNQGSPQRTRGSLRVFDRTFKHEELERDLAVRSEERRKWFEAPDSGVLQTDGPARDLFHKGCEKELMGQSLSEEQRSRLKEEIEKKWLELECLPLRESKRVPLTALLNQSREGHGDTSEALEKEVGADLLSGTTFVSSQFGRGSPSTSMLFQVGLS